MEKRASRFRASVARLNAGGRGRREFTKEHRLEALNYLEARRAEREDR